MKRMIRVFTIALIVIMLFTGCKGLSFLSVKPQPVRHSYEQYGFSFAISGEVTPRGYSTYGNAVFDTDLGVFRFEVFDKRSLPDNISNAYQFAEYLVSIATSEMSEIVPLKNGACYLVESNSYNKARTIPDEEEEMIGLVYLIQVGPSVWAISCSAPKDSFDKEAILNACMRVEFYW